MNRKYEYGVGAIRFLAMCCIVICHILQHQGYRLAFYFNIGVPVFLVISGYLFGKREISSAFNFLKNRFLRILVPYYLMLVIIVLVNLGIGESFTVKKLLSMLLCQQWFGNTIPNCGHLWYISCILVCYLATPILQRICEHIQNTYPKAYWLIFALCVILLQLIQYVGGIVTGAHFYAAYLFGYFYAYYVKLGKQQLKPWIINSAFVFGMVGFAGIYTLEKLGIRIPGIVFEYYKVVQAAIGCLFFIHNSKWFAARFWKMLIAYGDKYSYTVYLGHHIFILGSLSVLRLTNIYSVNVLLAAVLTIVCAVVLELLSDLIYKVINMRSSQK